MGTTTALGAVAAFCLGAGLALLATYPVEENSLLACAVGLMFVTAALVIGATAAVLHGVRQHSSRADRIIEATIRGILARQGLTVVREDRDRERRDS